MQLVTCLRRSLLVLAIVMAQTLPCLSAINEHPSTTFEGVNPGALYRRSDFTNGQIAQLNVPRDAAGQKGSNLVARQCNLNSFDPKVINLEARVSYAFCLVLGRLPDATGLQFWTAHLKRPIPVTAMLEGMVASDEFRTLNRLDTLSNEDFIAMVYKRFLLREADGGGAAAYVAELASGRVDRRAMIKNFIESHEFVMRHPVLSAPLQ
jgi:hypothetical protein